MSNSLEIYVLCHNRPDDTRQVIRSILNQSNKNFSLIISDNSSNDSVEKMVRQNFPDVHYIRREPMLAQLDHFNQCISEGKSDYFCLFHDDDIMHENYVDEFLKCICNNPAAAAWGCNAEIEDFGIRQTHKSFRSWRRIETMDSEKELASRYFSRHQSGCAPFPGYVYNRKLMGDILLPKGGGKYVDVTWLLKIIQRGKIFWISQPLMTYRIHGTNDGLTESLRDRLRLLGYLKSIHEKIGTDILDDYRCSFVYKKIVRSSGNENRTRNKIARKFLSAYSARRYMRIDTYKSLFKRLLIKLMAPK